MSEYPFKGADEISPHVKTTLVLSAPFVKEVSVGAFGFPYALSPLVFSNDNSLHP